jgi:hypothetical protein
MSRYTQTNSNIQIAYGFDNMLPEGGYFFQVFDTNKVSDENDEGIVLNEGFLDGISKERMFNLMTEYKVKNEEHLQLVAMDLPI